jgi:hypothetical protein
VEVEGERCLQDIGEPGVTDEQRGRGRAAERTGGLRRIPKAQLNNIGFFAEKTHSGPSGETFRS